MNQYVVLIQIHLLSNDLQFIIYLNIFVLFVSFVDEMIFID